MHLKLMQLIGTFGKLSEILALYVFTYLWACEDMEVAMAAWKALNFYIGWVLISVICQIVYRRETDRLLSKAFPASRRRRG